MYVGNNVALKYQKFCFNNSSNFEKNVKDVQSVAVQKFPLGFLKKPCIAV
jgi:hypothetical protein